MKPDRWVVRVTFASGHDAYLRHGGVSGEGAIVQFRTRARADAEADFVREGLGSEDAVAVVRYTGREDD